ncbi:CBS domain-containing protein [Sphaerimonospora mesophila]|uniref:CBS domain-containing protein n=1 Tax=Sphaerimonospora mesophila TaxID=37483 RepID=UPI0006E20D44
MRARDLITQVPTVMVDSPVIEAARLMVERDLPGLIVLDERRTPFTILPGTQVLRLAVPGYCQDDPTLARVIDEAHADEFIHALGDLTVRRALPDQPRELPVTDPDATVLEVAALMARTRSPIVAVVDSERLLGAVTLNTLMTRLVGT